MIVGSGHCPHEMSAMHSNAIFASPRYFRMLRLLSAWGIYAFASVVEVEVDDRAEIQGLLAALGLRILFAASC